MPLATLNDFQVNSTTANEQAFPSITQLADGRLLAVWASDKTGAQVYEIRGRFINQDGTTTVPDFTINSTTALSHDQPNVTMLADGRLVVTWNIRSASGTDIQARILSANGSLVAPDFIVNSTTASTQSESTVTKLSNGGFVVTWFSNEGGSFGNDIRARVYDAGGNSLSADFIVNTARENSQTSPHVTALANGRFVITWEGGNVAGNDQDIRARFFNANGTSAVNEFTVNSSGVNNGVAQFDPSITALADGRTFIAWETGSEVRGRFVSSAGTPTGSDFILNASGPGLNADVSVVTLKDGRIFAAWESTGGGTNDIRGRVINTDGTFAGADFVINSTTAGAQEDVTLSVMADGRVAVAWNSAEEIRSTIVQPLVYYGVNGGDSWIGGSFGEWLYGNNGADSFFGFGGSDNLFGGNGADSLHGGDAGDVIYGGADIDTLFGDAGADTIYGEDGNDVVDGGLDNDVLSGGNGADFLHGGDANDAIYGGVDIDTLFGDAGSDKIYGEDGNDVIDGGLDNDILVGGAGADALIGGTGSDYSSYYSSAAAVKVYMRKTSSNQGDAAGDTYGSIENISGSNIGSDTIYANNASNYLKGNGGNDILVGYGGNDTLVGGKGKDRMSGGTGVDKYYYTSRSEAGDSIKSFSSADYFVFKSSAFSKLKKGMLKESAFWSNTTGKAHDSTDRFILETDTGRLYYDSNGSSSGGSKAMIADVDGTFKMSYTDILIV